MLHIRVVNVIGAEEKEGQKEEEKGPDHTCTAIYNFYFSVRLDEPSVYGYRPLTGPSP